MTEKTVMGHMKKRRWDQGYHQCPRFFHWGSVTSHMVLESSPGPRKLTFHRKAVRFLSSEIQNQTRQALVSLVCLALLWAIDWTKWPGEVLSNLNCFCYTMVLFLLSTAELLSELNCSYAFVLLFAVCQELFHLLTSLLSLGFPLSLIFEP